MDWPTVIAAASGISTLLSLVAFFGALYVWRQSKSGERSLREIIDGEHIVDRDRVVVVLKTFHSDDHRLEALKEILGNDAAKSARIIKKVKEKVDVGELSLQQQVSLSHRLATGGIVLILLAVIGGIGTLASNSFGDPHQHQIYGNPLKEPSPTLPPPPTPTPTPPPTPPQTPTPPPSISKLTVTLTISKVISFIEFKVESDEAGVCTTGHITGLGTQTWNWDMGSNNQHVWFWWDTLSGDATLTIRAGEVVVFQGLCSHIAEHEVRVKDTSTTPQVYVVSGSPHLREGEYDDKGITYIEF